MREEVATFPSKALKSQISWVSELNLRGKSERKVGVQARIRSISASTRSLLCKGRQTSEEAQ
jgi:hypothetical protein